MPTGYLEDLIKEVSQKPILSDGPIKRPQDDELSFMPLPDLKKIIGQ